jgi:hypothetical protein
MKRILVAYATLAGSTIEVAQAVAEEIARPDVQMVIIQAPAGDRRNWTAIRSWAARLPVALQLEPPLADGLAENQLMPLAPAA